MPEYLAPGVFLEETSFRAKTIEGVGTSTAGFVGPTRYGPIDLEPEILTSLVDYERVYGGKERLFFLDDSARTVAQTDNFMWHAVRAFFEEGGKRLYVSRAYRGAGSPPAPGFSSGMIGQPSAPIRVRARFPGRAGDARVTFTLGIGRNVLLDIDPASPVPVPGVTALQDRDVVLIRDAARNDRPSAIAEVYLAIFDGQSRRWRFAKSGEGADPDINLDDLDPNLHSIHVITTALAVQSVAPDHIPYFERDLPLDPRHQRDGFPDSLFDAFAPHEPDPGNIGAKIIADVARARSVPIVIDADPSLRNGIDVLWALFDDCPSPPSLSGVPQAPGNELNERSIEIDLTGGHDGMRPAADDYAGEVGGGSDRKSGLKQFEGIEDISIVAAPGSTFDYRGVSHGPEARKIVLHLIRHAERMKYRIAVIDSGNNQSIDEVRSMRAEFNSTHAAFYYPWIQVLDPLTERAVNMPPSGFVSGIFVRNDAMRGVHKAPANEVVTLATGLERSVDRSQRDVLNAEGVNCFRIFVGRGILLWGARTISSDPEWKYVNLRRYIAYIERSIDKGTQWTVFEPNGEQLWATVRRLIADYLLNEWRTGALLGEKPEKAFFVKCDRSTMSQSDLDNGRLICLIGVALLRPAEFVIFRIGQWTAERSQPRPAPPD